MTRYEVEIASNSKRKVLEDYNGVDFVYIPMTWEEDRLYGMNVCNAAWKISITRDPQCPTCGNAWKKDR